MKKKLFFIIQICIVLFATTGFYGCNDTVDTGTDDTIIGVSILPNPMTIGQTVCISGPGFKEATAIIFPGNVSVTNFTRTGDFQLNAIVPAEAASEGNISVTLPGETFVIPLSVTIIATKDITAMAKDRNPETNNYRVGPNDELIITGQGLGVIDEIEIPGGVLVNSMNFVKKTDFSIRIDIPMGGFDRDAVGRVKMITKSKEVIYTSNTIDWRGEGYVPPGWLLLAGRSSSKTWEWDDSNGTCYGMGDFRNETNPSWWAAPGGKSFVSGEGLGATMTFAYKGKKIKDLTLTKNKTDGSAATGYWSIDLDERFELSSRAKGKIRTSNVTVLSGRGDAGVDVFEYWILNLTDNKMLIGIPEMDDDWNFDQSGWGQGNLWLFKTLE